MGRCEKCGRNVEAKSIGSQWVPNSHESLQGSPAYKGGNTKRSGKR
jgi:hypothetical protein